MSVAETIKTAREALGMTQEDLAEKLEVSRQAVSKWELGMSLPSPENLAVLEEVLDVTFPTEPEAEEETEAKAEPTAPPERPLWKTWAVAIGILMGVGLLCGVLHFLSRWNINGFPEITGIYWFAEDGKPLHPDLGDGWCKFEPGTRVILVILFDDHPEQEVNEVALYLTPSGTETFDEREQLAVQAMQDGQKFALFVLDIPESMMGELEIRLECSVKTAIERINVTSIS